MLGALKLRSFRPLFLQVASLIGSEGDATPFTDVTVENISHTLHGLGYQCRGWEVMYNGHTGMCRVFCSMPVPASSKNMSSSHSSSNKVIFSTISRLRPFILFSWHVGRQLQAQIFLNPTYYQRLKHMVDFKIHSRQRGPLQVGS